MENVKSAMAGSETVQADVGAEVISRKQACSDALPGMIAVLPMQTAAFPVRTVAFPSWTVVCQFHCCLKLSTKRVFTN